MADAPVTTPFRRCRHIGFFALLAVASCGDPNTAERGARDRLSAGEVARIAVAPDGTVLWGVRHNGNIIYFSSGSAQRTEACGKNCTRTIFVPTAKAQGDG